MTIVLTIIEIVLIVVTLRMAYKDGQCRKEIELFEVMHKAIENTEPGTPEATGRIQAIKEIQEHFMKEL